MTAIHVLQHQLIKTEVTFWLYSLVVLITESSNQAQNKLKDCLKRNLQRLVVLPYNKASVWSGQLKSIKHYCLYLQALCGCKKPMATVSQ